MANPAQPLAATPPTNYFRLGPGDVIEIEILGEAGTSTATLVGPDGKLYYSLLPGLFVWGLTLSDTKTLLEDSLAKYIRVKPEVAVSLRSVGSQRYWVLGSIQRPGAYPMAGPISLLEAISAAGGTLFPTGSSHETAVLNHSFVMRDGRLLGVDLARLLQQGDLSQNIYLQPNDFVHVRPVVAHDIYVLGAVAGPNVVPYSDQASVVSAIASVGGPVQYAYLSHVAVLRGSLTSPRVMTVDYPEIVKGRAPDVRLEPGDIVYVPRRPFWKLEQFAEEMLDQFVRTIAVNEGFRATVEDAAPVGVTVPLSTPPPITP